MNKIIIQTDPIDISSFINLAGTRADGAVVTFIGRARDFSNNRNVQYLEYEIYEEMALRELNKIADEAINRWSLNSCIIIHRYGKVNIGEASILIIVASPHRDEAYKASRYIIDAIKEKVPIWKKEYYTDGSNWITERS